MILKLEILSHMTDREEKKNVAVKDRNLNRMYRKLHNPDKI